MDTLPHPQSCTPFPSHICACHQSSSHSARLSATDQPPSHSTHHTSSIQPQVCTNSIPTPTSTSTEPPECQVRIQQQCSHLGQDSPLDVRFNGGAAFRLADPHPGHPICPWTHFEGLPPQDGAPWQCQTTVAFVSSKRQVFSRAPAPCRSGQRPPSPPVSGMCQSSRSHTSCQRICSSPDSVLQRPSGRRAKSVTAFARSPGAAPHGSPQTGHHRWLSRPCCTNNLTTHRHGSGETVTDISASGAAIQATSPPLGCSSEDFCLTPQVFQTFLQGLGKRPHPNLDCWACAEQHVLPRYISDFYHHQFVETDILWVNPRFSELDRVLDFLLSHQLAAYVLFPHWTDATWWNKVWSRLTWHTFFHQGIKAFKSVVQPYPLPCPWPFYVAWIDHRPSSCHIHDPPHTKYWQLLATAGYPPIPHGYGKGLLPKCYTRANPPDFCSSSVLLDEVCSQRLDLDALISLGHHLNYPHIDTLRHMALCLRSKASFLGLFNRAPFKPGAGRASRLSNTVVNQMLQWQLLRLDINPAFYCRCFLVLKANKPNLARLISDCTPLNNCIDCPWRCRLAKIPNVTTLILSWKYAALLDFQSYYFQYAVGAEVQPFFGFRQPGTRGCITVLPQGFGPSASIAQTGSGVIIHDLPATCHMDNIAAGANSYAAVAQILQEIVRRCSITNITLKDPSPPILQHFEHLGLEFDLVTRQFRLSQAWAMKSADFIAALHIVLSEGGYLPLRILWQALGIFFWASYATGILLAPYWALMQFTRHASREPQWDKPTTMPTPALKQLVTVISVLRTNDWLSPPTLPPQLAECRAVIANDSCESGAAYCYQYGHIFDTCDTVSSSASFTVSWWPWPPLAANRGMPTKEALACLRSLEEALPHIPEECDPILWLVDCNPVVQAIHKGFSAAPLLNSIVAQLRASTRRILWVWIPTELQPADIPSRRKGFGPPQRVRGHLLTPPLLHWLHQHQHHLA